MKLRWLSAAWLPVLLLVPLAPTAVVAQVPTPRDTVRPAPEDTLQVDIPPGAVAADTLPDTSAGAVSDSLLPPPLLPAFPDLAPTGWAYSEWVWDRDELLRVSGVSLVDLLMLVPGINITRSGGFGRPAGITPLGLGGSRLRIFVDGYEQDPLIFATSDLYAIGLADLDRVRLVRSLNEIRVELVSYRLDTREPYSLVEAATGSVQNTRTVRALFSRPAWGNNVVTAGLDLLNTRGAGRREPFATASGFARWTHAFSPRTGLRLDYRQTDVDREGAPFDQSTTSRSLVLRGRTQLTDDLTVDASLGRTRTEPDESDGLNIAGTSTQGVLRAAWNGQPVWANASARFRAASGGYVVPSLDLVAEAGFRPAPWASATGRVRFAQMGDISGPELEVTARVAPWRGLAAFATVAAGTRGLGFAADTTFPVTRLVRDTVGTVGGVVRVDTIVTDTTVLAFRTAESTSRSLRVGAEWVRGTAVAGAAFVRSDADRVVPFGFGFDLRLPNVEPGTATGVEAFASLPVFVEPLRFEGWITSWSETGDRPYLPVQEWRAALSFHDLFYTGNLEPTVRVELLSRGSALVPGTDTQGFTSVSEPYTLLNAFLQVRVVDVRVFGIFENLLNDNGAADLIGRRLGTRAIIGVRWSFRG